MKRLGKAIASVSLALALLAPASINVCAEESKKVSKTEEKKEQTVEIEGQLCKKEKNSFQILYVLDERKESQICITEFKYEILQIEHDDGRWRDVKTILAPHPTTYEVGAYIKVSYEPRSGVSFSELSEKYAQDMTREYIMGNQWVTSKITRHKPVQDGILEIDGILKIIETKDKVKEE